MTLDTEGKPGAVAAVPVAAPAPAPAAPAPAPAAAAVEAASATPSSGGRVPSIRFRHGARDAINAELGLSSRPVSVAAPTAAAPAAKPAAAVAPAPAGSYAEQVARSFPSKANKSYLDLPPMYGRPRIGEAEARAIESGGAW